MSGIIGIYGIDNQDVGEYLQYGLYALQHRGQYGTGVATIDNNQVRYEISNQLASSLFTPELFEKLKGNKGVGYTYYIFKEKPEKQPAFPRVFADVSLNSILVVDGTIPEGSVKMDELVARLRANQSDLPQYLQHIPGAFALIYIDEQKMIGYRDIHGLKPLALGKKNNAFILASETAALDATEAHFEKDIHAGELITITKDGYTIASVFTRARHLCLFEFVYLARPDSYLDGRSVYKARHEMGRLLYKEQPSTADLVMGAPDSGIPSAIGYANTAAIPYIEGIIKNRYVTRTFIEPHPKRREKKVRIKLNPIRENIQGKDIILVDDSIIQATTIARIINMLKEAGANEIHVRIAAPPVLKSCRLCIEIPKEEKLIAYHKTIDEIREHIGATSLYFLSLEGLIQAAGSGGFCTHCFGGSYPADFVHPHKE